MCDILSQAIWERLFIILRGAHPAFQASRRRFKSTAPERALNGLKQAPDDVGRPLLRTLHPAVRVECSNPYTGSYLLSYKSVGFL